MSYTDEQIKAARRALSGQDEEPVVLETDMAGGGHTDAGPNPGTTSVPAERVLAFVEAQDPRLLQLAVAQARIEQLEQVLAATPVTKGESEG